MERFDRRLHVRVSKADVERAQRLARTLNITTSAIVKLLLQLPVEDVAAKGSGSPDMASYMLRPGILREGNAERHHAPKLSEPFSRTQGASAQHSNASEHVSEHQHTRQRDDGRERQR